MAQHNFVHGIGILVDKPWFQRNFVHEIGILVDKQEFWLKCNLLITSYIKNIRAANQQHVYIGNN